MALIEIISHSFPTRHSAFDATFVKDHLNAISREFEARLSVPTPFSIPFTERFKKSTSELLLPPPINGKRIRYLSLPRKKFPKFIQAALSKQLITHLKKTGPDLIHVHFLYPSGLAIPQIKKFLHCPIVLTVHGVDFYHTQTTPVLRNLVQSSLLAADAVIAVGPKLHQDLLAAFPVLKSKLSTIFNYVDTSKFHPIKPERKAQLKSKLGLIPSKFQLLCVANFRHKKGLDLLVEALTHINNKDAIEVHIIGRIDEEPKFQQRVEAKLNTLHLDNVHIHGPKPRTQVREWMWAADGFILPSRNEPFGIALIEAMACGLPVVSTKSGGPEVILAGEWGVLIEPNDCAEIARALSAMVEGNFSEKMGRLQHRYIEENFGISNYSNAHEKIYTSLLS